MDKILLTIAVLAGRSCDSCIHSAGPSCFNSDRVMRIRKENNDPSIWTFDVCPEERICEDWVEGASK